MIVGIDPGLTGAFAALADDGSLHDVFDMPTNKVAGKNRIDPHRLIDWVIQLGEVELFALESVSGFGMGAVSAFTFGQGYGLVQGVLATLQRPVVLVTPQAWTKALGVGSDKGLHRATASSLFPSQADRFARVMDSDRADAVLIAFYAQRNLSRLART